MTWSWMRATKSQLEAEQRGGSPASPEGGEIALLSSLVGFLLPTIFSQHNSLRTSTSHFKPEVVAQHFKKWRKKEYTEPYIQQSGYLPTIFYISLYLFNFIFVNPRTLYITSMCSITNLHPQFHAPPHPSSHFLFEVKSQYITQTTALNLP